MVFYYQSSEGHVIYVGRDKFENEDLIKHGWEEDVWFHVDNLSSPHVYLRLKEGETWDKISETILQECAQLVKADSIQGSKQAQVKIVYTPWENLLKTHDMEIGAIGFKSEKNKKYINYVKKDRDILRVLQKTKSADQKPDFAALKQEKIQAIKNQQKKEFEKQAQLQKQIEKKQKEEAQLRNYDLMYKQLLILNCSQYQIIQKIQDGSLFNENQQGYCG
ncbi:hypothetical protein PPERSA_05675 [Pseudocohnilembus persalinus]|uniref:NFACT RNA-binding domain-containing protein n=1 Tax=Pseudocohnilembus persalinus TaxID=266149 RepID=A0A0V0QMZ6_PSEPJ|nr:hypothetical protein PPERSA_05675 [Pseudocohnilembus persalinus]|eukprot:KRX03317.1 hypothetical protein PPERSA_05675 [Pseudocohnilembus persalinus]